MAGHSDSSSLRRPGLTRRVVAAALTMILLFAGCAVGCLAGLHAAEVNAHGSEAHAAVIAHHLPHERTAVASELELLAGEGPVGVVEGTADFHVDLTRSLQDGTEGCAHNVHDPKDGTLTRVSAPDLQILHAASGRLVVNRIVPVRVAGVTNASPRTPSIVQLAISRT